MRNCCRHKSKQGFRQVRFCAFGAEEGSHHAAQLLLATTFRNEKEILTVCFEAHKLVEIT